MSCTAAEIARCDGRRGSHMQVWRNADETKKEPTQRAIGRCHTWRKRPGSDAVLRDERRVLVMAGMVGVGGDSGGVECWCR